VERVEDEVERDRARDAGEHLRQEHSSLAAALADELEPRERVGRRRRDRDRRRGGRHRHDERVHDLAQEEPAALAVADPGHGPEILERDVVPPVRQRDHSRVGGREMRGGRQRQGDDPEHRVEREADREHDEGVGENALEDGALALLRVVDAAHAFAVQRFVARVISARRPKMMTA
jgi:hypothetical protein